MEIALEIALLVISFVLIGLVILQGRNAGLQSRDTSSIYRTKRGLEKTIYQTTIVLAAVFLVLTLVAGLFLSSTSVTTAPTGFLGMLGLA